MTSRAASVCLDAADPHARTRWWAQVPGVDGVGRKTDGTLVYSVLPDTTIGSMAERAVVDARRSVAPPAGTDTDLVTAAMNPGRSSWVVLRRASTSPQASRSS